MAGPTRIESDLHVNGNLSCKTFSPPINSVGNLAIPAGAGIDPLKMGHQHRPIFNQPNTTATTETRAVWSCRGATGSVIEFRAGSIAIAVGAATVTFDLKKNGTTILTGVLTLNSSSVARVAQVATIATAGLVAGDELEVVITATAGGGTIPTGIFYQLTIHEDPQ